MKKNISYEEIRAKILAIFDDARWSPLSIREVTLKLKEDYDINLNPRIVKAHLFKLKEEGKIEQ